MATLGSGNPEISVLMPCYNCADFLHEAVDSILAQTRADFELLLIDDGSKDDTDNICRSYAKIDKRVKHIKKPNTGLVDTLNHALLRCRGKYIARMDGDDISLPHRFDEQIRIMEFARASAVSCGFLTINDRGDVQNSSIPPKVSDFEAEWFPAREPYLPHPFLMIKTDVLLTKQGYRHVIFSEDADLFWRLVDNHRIWVIPDVLGKYRIHGKSISTTSSYNGRIQCLFAQMAAASYLRRRKGEPDLQFDFSIPELKAVADDFESLMRIIGRELKDSEYRFVAAGGGLKFLDFSRFRNYEVKIIDIDFTLYNLRRVSYISPNNLEWANWMVNESYKRFGLHDRRA
jgi:glycosyltransferase involved in cell wall biosynthesis